MNKLFGIKDIVFEWNNFYAYSCRNRTALKVLYQSNSSACTYYFLKTYLILIQNYLHGGIFKFHVTICNYFETECEKTILKMSTIVK